MKDLKEAIKRYFKFYNTERFHEPLEYMTPKVMYESFLKREDFINATYGGIHLKLFNNMY